MNEELKSFELADDDILQDTYIYVDEYQHEASFLHIADDKIKRTLCDNCSSHSNSSLGPCIKIANAPTGYARSKAKPHKWVKSILVLIPLKLGM